MLVVLLAATLAVQSGSAPPSLRPPAPVTERPAASPLRPLERALLDSIEAAALRFFDEWGLMWRRGEAERHAFEFDEFGMRERNIQLHCHPDIQGEYARLRSGSMIRSDSSWYAVCPTWYLGDVGSSDERIAIDNALPAEQRSKANAGRQRLIEFLATAARALPENGWIAGQRVRLLVDQRKLGEALDVARACTASAWWCAQLTGYVLAVRGEIVAAESTFVNAHARLPLAERCRHGDVTDLLDSASRAEYAKIACAERASINDRIWWLADPLYIEPGNERRVEQYVRDVLVAFRNDIDRDERYNWHRSAGGDALQRMIARYGWPAYTYWNGLRTDAQHSGYLVGHGTAMNEPYTTFEYGAGRVHLLPSWPAVADPLRALASHWAIGDTARADQWSLSRWWPREHFAPRRPLVQLPDPQVAFFRREPHVIVAAASDLDPSRVGRIARTPVEATLVLTERPGDARTVGGGSGLVGEPLVVRADVPSRPALMGIEFMAATASATAPPGGRTRLGIAPPATLAQLAAGGVAISDPVILRAPADGAELPSDPDAAIPRMAGSTRVPASKRIGVYWETYGFRPADSVDVAVWIERFTSQGIVRRFGIALRVATDLNTPIALSWTEPDPARRSYVIHGNVPIVGRSVTLDVSMLPRGEYWLDVAVGKPEQEPVRGRRAFTVR